MLKEDTIIQIFSYIEKCGMGRTTLYQYFKNKDDIFYHIIGNALEEIQTQIEVITAND